MCWRAAGLAPEGRAGGGAGPRDDVVLHDFKGSIGCMGVDPRASADLRAPLRPLPSRKDWHRSRADACAPLPPGHQARDAEGSPLHQAVRLHRAAFVEDARRAGHSVPRVVERELDGFLSCGVLAHGFARVRCSSCGHELLVPFSCKRRGICPSCTARRAEDTAAHLVDRVLPKAPYRQWVFTFPIAVRLALSRRPDLVSAALRVCLRALFAWQRRRARSRGVKRPTAGAVTFVQRFGSALQLNVHFHVLVPDGVFDDGGHFVADEPPNDDDVLQLLLRCGRRVLKLLRRFFAGDDHRVREFDGLFAALDTASAQPLPTLFPLPTRRAPLSAFVEGFSLHAATRVMASDRRGLSRLCAYGARGAVAWSRLCRLDDGRFAYNMKRSLPDGRSQLVMTGVELLKKLVPLVPPAYANLTRFHGVFAPTSRLRALIVPPAAQLAAAPAPVADHCERQNWPPGLRAENSAPAPVADNPAPAAPRPAFVPSGYRLDWAALLKRVFAVDVMVCSKCEGPMKVLAFLEDPKVVKGILMHLGLRAEPLPVACSRGPPPELFEAV